MSKKVNLIILNVNHARYSGISILKYIYKYKPEILLVFSYELSVMLVILRYLMKLKIKIVSRNVSTLSIRIKELKRKSIWTRYILGPLIIYLYKKVDHIVNQCQDMQDDLIKVHPELKQISSVIYNPVASNILEYVHLNDLKNIQRENYLLCIGRLEEVKAYHFAIESFAGIADRFPTLRLKFVGQGSLENKLKKKAVDLAVSDRVDFEGFQKNIIPYYLYAKATILTSFYEGYPNVLIESIALGTPVVGFDCKSGPSEIIQNNKNGYLVRYLDVEDLKDKISQILITNFNREDVINTVKKNQIKYISKLYEKLISSLTNV